MQDRTLIRSGRILVAVSVVLAVAGMGIVAMLGGWEYSFNDGVVHLGIAAVGFGWLVWATIARQVRNGVLWALAAAALFGALFAAGFAALIIWGRGAFPDFTAGVAGKLAPVDVPLPVAIAMQPLAWAWLPAFGLVLTLGLLMFPDGRLPSPRWRWATWYCLVTMALSVGYSVWIARPSSNVPLLETPASMRATTAYLTSEILDVLAVSGALLGIAALFVRYRRSTGSVRRQIRWIGWGAAFLTVGLFWTLVVDETSLAATSPLIALGAEAVLIMSFAIAITRYRLYEIDVVISRTAAYSTLALMVAGLYVAAVFGLAALFGEPAQGVADLGVGFWFVATALVAFAFEPLRVRFERLANRVVYGQRTPPAEVLSQLTSHLSEAPRSEGLAGLARLLREGTGAETAVVWLGIGGQLRPEAASPDDAPMTAAVVATEGDLPASELELSIPVRQRGELLGALGISKPRAHPVTPADEALLSDVAAGAGLLLRNLRLNAELATRAAELRASRRRLIAAHDAARHRLERDLHDGAQQQIVALKVRLGLAEAIAGREGAPELATTVAGLAEATQHAVDSMRKIARGIYPPLLDTDGLGPALTAAQRTFDLPVSLDLATLPRYSKELEESVFFCVLAGVTRAKMAGATAARVEVSGDDAALTLRVMDDSVSDPGELTALTDRVYAFGGTVTVANSPGGTRLLVRLPVLGEEMEPA
jgi:signal transduction histidine kinase